MITEATLAACAQFDAQIWSDLYKDAHGFRPRFDLSDYTAAELDALWERTCEALSATMAEDAAREAACVKAFHGRVEGMVADFSITPATALRWMVQADEVHLDQGWGYACYIWGLPYNMEKELEAIAAS